MSREKPSMQILRKVVVDLFLLMGLLICLMAMDLWWQPFKRGFFCWDESLMFPYKVDTVSVIMLRLFGVVLPFLAFLICEWAVLHNKKDDVRCLGVRIPAWVRGFYCVGICFGLGCCYSELITAVAKNVIGRPRPYFFDMCKPSVDCNDAKWQHRYIQPSEYTCLGTQTDKFRNMIRSFLSGHSSWSAFTMVYLALYLEKRMHWRGSRTLRHTLQFGAITLSWFVALSRVSDYAHHWSDVLAGYSLGVVVAVIAWTYCTDLVEKKDHTAVPQHEVTLNSHRITNEPA